MFVCRCNMQNHTSMYMRTVGGVYCIDVPEDLRVTVPEEEPGGLRGVVADELEVGVPEAASANAEWVREAQVAARLGTACERSRRGNGPSAGSLRRCRHK